MPTLVNHARLVGTVVRPPTLRFTPDGTPLLLVDLGGDTTDTRRGVPPGPPWYQRVWMTGIHAPGLQRRLDVGTPVAVRGYLSVRTWTGDDGEPRRTLDVIANDITPLEASGDPDDDADDGVAPVTLDARGQPRLRRATNRVRLAGTLATTPRERGIGNGASYAVTDLALPASATPNGVPATVPLRTVAGDGAPDVFAALRAGDETLVEGHLTTDAWTDEEGCPRWQTRIAAERIWLISCGDAPEAETLRAQDGAAASSAAPSGTVQSSTG